MGCGNNRCAGANGRAYSRRYFAGHYFTRHSEPDAVVVEYRPGVLETTGISTMDTHLACNEGEGVSQAVGALAFAGPEQRTVSAIAAYVTAEGTQTGSFQMAILQPISNISATVIAVTITAAFITDGIFRLPLTSPVVLAGGEAYYLAVYNQVGGSSSGGVKAGFDAATDAPPINFRIQNLTGFSVGDVLSLSDLSLRITPWLAAY